MPEFDLAEAINLIVQALITVAAVFIGAFLASRAMKWQVQTEHATTWQLNWINKAIALEDQSKRALTAAQRELELSSISPSGRLGSMLEELRRIGEEYRQHLDVSRLFRSRYERLCRQAFNVACQSRFSNCGDEAARISRTVLGS